MPLTPQEIRDAYRDSLLRVGELNTDGTRAVAIRRYGGSGADRPFADVPVLARVVGYEAKELVDPIVQGDRRLIVYGPDLEDAGFSFPVRKNDKVVIRGKEVNIESPDDNTRRVAGVLIAIEMRVRG
ncbi:hypothetical protein [Mesorhizobium sp.]|uniref:hypothetical protein n=1 Tax=Mesorhizobium sp. TaxID=1871066 RepID=UPI0025D23A9D|nr:hypothetical protein [Mesorhizobium sp.]